MKTRSLRSSLASQGPIRRVCCCETRWSKILLNCGRRWLWVPAFAGTTLCVLPDEQINARGVGLRVHPRQQKYFSSRLPQIKFRFAPCRLSEGRFAIVTDVRRDAVDADALADERRDGGRRSRVVLTPRRWRSSLAGLFPRDDGDKKARSPGRARRKPLKPLRGECRVFRCDRGD